MSGGLTQSAAKADNDGLGDHHRGDLAAEMAEAVFGGHHYRILFMLGSILFVVTFITNMLGDIIIHRLKHRLEGKA